MTHFLVTMEVTCPSNWTDSDVRTWVNKILSGKEPDTVKIETVNAPTPNIRHAE